MTRTAAEQANADFVVDFFNNVLCAMDSSRVDDYIAPDYIQHSMLAEPGVDALKQWLDKVRVESPDATQHMYRLFTEGDHVITHQHVCRWKDDPGLGVVDIYRLENGKIVEHWDVVQDVPTEPVNSNSMF